MMPTEARVSRRAALAGIGGMAAASILAACGGTKTATPTAAGNAPTTAAIVPQIVTPSAGDGRARILGGAGSADRAAASAARRRARPQSSGRVKRGGQLRIMQINDFVSMDPIFASGPTASACYDWLLAWRPNAQGQFGVQPQLAKSWDV